MVANAQDVSPGEVGEGNSVSGGRSWLSTNDQVDGFISVGTIKCSSFRGFGKCDHYTM